jgi:hypothetical protein
VPLTKYIRPSVKVGKNKFTLRMKVDAFWMGFRSELLESKSVTILLNAA